MKILLIEDHVPTAESLKRHLAKTYVVDAVRTGKDGLRHAENSAQDLIILDLNLPDMHGFDVCRALRARHCTAPILILTGVADTASLVRLLEAGADDYMLKPFNGAELLARLRALGRRIATPYSPAAITVADLLLDPFQRRVERAGTVITLRRKEFDILEYLVRNRGRAVSRAMIFDHVWEAGHDGWNNTVDVHIKHLRDKVDRPFAEPLIKTAYGIGYMVDDVK